MKYGFLLLSLVLLASCQSNSNNENTSSDPYLVSDEVFKMKLGTDEVYGVRLKMTSPAKRAYLSYAIRLAQNEKIWFDTIYTEVNAGDTIENELIFSEAMVNPDDKVEVQTQSITIE